MSSRDKPKTPPSFAKRSSASSERARASVSSKRKNKSSKNQLAVTSTGRIRHLSEELKAGNYIVFDIETTGGNPEKNGITEIFAVRFESGQIKDTFYTLVNPKIPIPPIVRKMTGISNKLVKDAPVIEEVMADFVSFIKGDVLVSHNTIGDMKFLRYFSQSVTGRMIENYYLCTHLLIEKLHPEAPDKSLKGLAQHFRLKASDQLHRAEADAYLTLELFKVLLSSLIKEGIHIIKEAIRFQGDYESGMRIGWGIEDQDLLSLPESPGVFYLHDYSGRVTFLASAHNIARDVRKLKKLNLLPRQLLKAVIASTRLSYTETTTTFGAALAEAQGLYQHEIRFDPGNWHQRTANFLYVKKTEDEFVLTTGPLVQGAIAALGPVRGGKDVSVLIEQLGRFFQRKVSKKGLKLDVAQARMLVDFLVGVKNGSSSRAVWGRLKQLWQVFSMVTSTKEDQSELNDLSIPVELNRLEACSGILAMPRGDAWFVYLVACGIPIGEFQTHGDLIQSLRLKNGHLKLFKKIKKAILRKRDAGFEGMPIEEVFLINRTFWWAYFGSRHEDVRVFSMEDLASL